jgi:hypothetical protein
MTRLAAESNNIQIQLPILLDQGSSCRSQETGEEVDNARVVIMSSLKGSAWSAASASE